MKKLLSLLLSVCMVCSFAVPALAAEDTTDIALTGVEATSASVSPYPDAQDHWAESAINRWSLSGIVQGDELGNMNPNKLLTRGEFAAMLVRLLGLKTKAANAFADLKGTEWYTDDILKVAAAGIMLGDGKGNCNGSRPISRQETMVMFARAMGLKPVADPDLSKFSDAADVADWAAGYIAPLADMGIINGVVPGEMVAAPKNNINRASTLALLDKAIKTYITAAGEYTVDAPKGFVVVNVPDAQVSLTGNAAGLVVAAGSVNADVTAKDLDTDALKVDAAADVTLDGKTAVDAVALNDKANLTINKDASVTDLDANAAAQIVNNGEVTNLNTNESGVTYDGNAPEKVNTAPDVEAAKDSDGKVVTEGTGSGDNGGSTVTPSRPNYKYKVDVQTAVGGKVTADVTRTNTANTEVTLTVTPDVQTADALPYVLKSLTVKNGETEVTVTDNKFTMATEGTYTVTAEFYQPLTEAELFIVNSEETFNHLADFGYTDNTTDMADLPEMQWIAVGVKRAEGLETKITDAVLTANGEDMSSKAWPGTFGKYSMAYVNENTRGEDENGAKLGLTGSAYKFVLTFTYEGAAYKLECDYLKHGVTEADLHTVTFKTSTGTELASYKAAKDDTVTAPAAPAIVGYYFTGWDTALTNNRFTVGETDAIITANYVEIGAQTIQTRPSGPANNGETDCNYGEVYAAAGVTLGTQAEDGSYTYAIDATTFLDYANAQDNKLGVLAATVGEKTYYFYGAAIMAPESAATLVLTKDKALTSLDDAAKYTEFDLASSEHSFTIEGQKCILHYFGAVADKDSEGVYGFQPDGAFTRYAKWVKEDGTVLAVNKLVLNRVTVNIPEAPEPETYTVTFKNGNTTVATKTVEENGTVTELPNVPTAAAGYTGGKWMVGETEFTTATVITADTTVNAKYTAITYTIYYDGVAESATMTVETEGNHTLKAAPAADTAHEGYHFTGWQILTACAAGDDGAVEDTNDAGKYYKWVDFSGEVAPADLPTKAVGKNANCIHFKSVWAPNYEVTFAAMSGAVYDLYKGDDEFRVGIPASLGLFQENITFEAGEKDCTFAVKGTLNAITDPAYAGFNQANAGEQTGYYLLFQFVAPEGTKANTQGNIVTTAKKSFTAANLDVVNEEEVFSFIWWVAAPETVNLNGKKIELTIDWDGNGEKVGTKYTLDLSGLTLKATTPDQGGEG